MKIFFVVFLAAWTFSVVLAQAFYPQGRWHGPFELVQVLDGSSFTIEHAGLVETVRLIGMAVPERLDPEQLRRDSFRIGVPIQALSALGNESAQRVSAWLQRPFYLEFDERERNEVGELLAYAYVPSPEGAWRVAERNFTQVNLAMVRSGWATSDAVPPNDRYRAQFQAASEAARQEGLGLWEGRFAEGDGRTSSIAINCVKFNPAGTDVGTETVTLSVRSPTDVTGWSLTNEDNKGFPITGLLEVGNYELVNPDVGVFPDTEGMALLVNASDEVVDVIFYGNNEEGVTCQRPF